MAASALSSSCAVKRRGRRHAREFRSQFCRLDAFGSLTAYNALVMAKKEKIFEVACPDCGAMLKIDAATGLVVSHTPAPRKRMFEDMETAAKAMREHDERKESIFRQSVEAEKNKADLLEKKFAEALKKAKDAPDVKPLREFDLD